MDGPQVLVRKMRRQSAYSDAMQILKKRLFWKSSDTKGSYQNVPQSNYAILHIVPKTNWHTILERFKLANLK